MTLKEKQFLVISLKQMIKDDADTIMDAYEEEYAPNCEGIGLYSQLNRSNVYLAQLLDMAACLLYDWYGDPDFKEIEDDFKL